MVNHSLGNNVVVIVAQTIVVFAYRLGIVVLHGSQASPTVVAVICYLARRKTFLYHISCSIVVQTACHMTTLCITGASQRIQRIG